MTATAETIPQAVGYEPHVPARIKAAQRARDERAQCRKAREAWADALPERREGATDGKLALTRADPDAPFSRPELSDDALTAAVWTCAKFDSRFPGWELYRRIMVGYEAFDAELLAWVIGCARKLARAKTANGRDYLRVDARGPWIALAAADALHAVIYGRYPVAADKHGCVRGVRLQTYRKIREPVAACIARGLESFRSELHYQYSRVWKAQMDEKADSMVLDGVHLRAVHAGSLPLIPGDGNSRTVAEPIHD